MGRRDALFGFERERERGCIKNGRSTDNL